jgi:hypothetical protein
MPVTGLFERFPEEHDLFRPLTGPNRRRLWELLMDLYEGFFGPDAPPSPEEGYRRREIVLAVENFLLRHESWIDEDEAPDQSLSGRANFILYRLIATGWLQEERIGVRNFIVMSRNVGGMLEALRGFAETGPQFVSGQVQMIHNTLRATEANPKEQAAAFSAAALEARHLVSTLNNTGVRVREVMALLGQEATTAGYVQAFFTDYIEKLYIRDYRELNTRNHPLRNQDDILRIVSDLRDDPDRRVLLADGYRKMLGNPDDEQLQAAMERDFARFRRFEDIGTHLSRLDSSITRAIRQATAYITYQLRTRGRIETLLRQASQAVATAAEAGHEIQTTWAPGHLFSQEALREPRAMRPPAERALIKRRTPTPEERALWMLHRVMARNREVSRRQIVEFLQRKVGDRGKSSSDELTIESVNDLVVFAALGRAALVRSMTTGRVRNDGLTSAIPGLKLRLESGEFTENEFLKATRFVVEWENS